MKPTNVDEYVASLPADHAAIVNELRGVIKKAAPKATEAYKWAQPVYELDGPMIWIRAYKSYVNIGFWRGTEMQDKHGLLEGEGDRMRHVKLASTKDIKKSALTDYIKQAIRLNETKGNPTQRMAKK
ncbi:MAG TPA: DUF1801 domain-containing protein [Anaerolineae bacterium]|nr:DUF1801 domain-containing protein [Anaerolineae bacterium]